MNQAPRNNGSARAIELDFTPVPPATVLLHGARVLDPRTGLDGVSDLLVRAGSIAEIGDSLEAPDGAEVVDAAGLHAFPAFVDPHVHLRTPGR
ncbi:MAG: dihydroorotase, partial [Thermoleophilaceae bacterium]